MLPVNCSEWRSDNFLFKMRRLEENNWNGNGLINKGDNFEDYIEEVRELNMIQDHRGHHKTEKDLWCTISHFLKIENVYQRVSLIKRSKIKSRMFIIWCLYRAPCVFLNQQCTHGTNQGKGP